MPLTKEEMHRLLEPPPKEHKQGRPTERELDAHVDWPSVREFGSQ